MPRKKSARRVTKDPLTMIAQPTVAKPAQPQSTRCYLFELPQEILHWNLRYCYLPPYPNAPTEQLESGTDHSRPVKCTHQSLLLTCHTIRDLTLEWYVSTHIIKFKEARSFGRIYRSFLTQPTVHHLRYISLDLYDSRNFEITQNGGLPEIQLSHVPYYNLILPEKLKRLVRLSKRFPELSKLEQCDIRLAGRHINNSLVHSTAVNVVENFISHQKSMGHTAYFILRESLSETVAWITIQRVSEEVWEKIPHEEEEPDKNCESGCGRRGVHFCALRQFEMVRACEDVVWQVQNKRFRPKGGYDGSEKENRAITWKAVRPLEFGFFRYIL